MEGFFVHFRKKMHNQCMYHKFLLLGRYISFFQFCHRISWLSKDHYTKGLLQRVKLFGFQAIGFQLFFFFKPSALFHPHLSVLICNASTIL
jgi:hypothetical protein